jgi:hypothetical protein
MAGGDNSEAWPDFRAIYLGKKMLASKRDIIVIIKASTPQDLIHPIPTMKIQTVASLLSIALLSACSTTSQTTAQRQTLEQRTMAKYAANDVNTQEPAPPAAGPEDVEAAAPAAGPNDVERNPMLVPTPLLRYWASSRTP